ACPFNLASCDITIPNPQEPVPTLQYPLCPDGTGGGDTATCSVNCQCTEFGGVIEIPENAITSQYNFTWFSTQLPPNTYDT
ncbi:hypothetical protein, partial [Chromatium okenii]|uniref:hypothetical protein n=1 Tax=Chromatium okenii TaxID=61644 RepID=UPI0026F34AE8